MIATVYLSNHIIKVIIFHKYISQHYCRPYQWTHIWIQNRPTCNFRERLLIQLVVMVQMQNKTSSSKTHFWPISSLHHWLHDWCYVLRSRSSGLGSYISSIDNTLKQLLYNDESSTNLCYQILFYGVILKATNKVISVYVSIVIFYQNTKNQFHREKTKYAFLQPPYIPANS